METREEKEEFYEGLLEKALNDFRWAFRRAPVTKTTVEEIRYLNLLNKVIYEKLDDLAYAFATKYNRIVSRKH